LVTKADKFKQAIKEKDSLINSLEKEKEKFDAKSADLQVKNKHLQNRQNRLVTASKMKSRLSKHKSRKSLLRRT